MARLDQLIGALVKHSAESIHLVGGQKPALIIGGSPRAIVKNALDINQVRQLVAEVAPPDCKNPVLAGLESEFDYDGGATPVSISVLADEVRIEPRKAAPAAAPVESTPEMTAAPVESTPEVTAAPVESTPEVTAAPESAVTTEPPVAAVPVAAAPPQPEATPRPAVVAMGDGLHMDTLLRALVEHGASDLHISAECQPMLRVDGELADLGGFDTLDASRTEALLLDVTPDRNREEFVATGDSDFGYHIEGLARFRANIFRDRKGPGGVFRVIPTDVLSAEQLGLAAAIQGFASLTKGLVLVTGPTGSGKSTTLAGLVDLVNSSRSEHIITIEDPIEFVHTNKKCLINQREVQIHTTSFKSALRAALREDPDVVLVGELRDLETVAIALETAETGHLVFGTLHTNSAVSTVDRIIDQFPGDEQARIRIMLSESLKGVVAQVLCRKIGGGRLAAHEVLVVNAAVSNLIREGKTFQIPSIMQTGRNIGMVTMNGALLELVRTKQVEPEEAYLKSVDKQGLLASFRSKNISTDFATTDKKVPQPA